MQYANLIEVRRLMWVCPICQYENILDDLDKCADPKQAEWCGHCGEVSQTQRGQIVMDETQYDLQEAHESHVAKLTAERDELLNRITELEAGLQAIIDHQRIVGGDNYMSLSTTANIAKAALAKHKGGE